MGSMDAPFDLSALPAGKVMTLSPLVSRILAPNPSAFTFTGTQSYLVGRDDVAVIDPGPADPDHIDALIRAIADRPVVAILCTHTHRDHSPAAAPLAARTGAAVIGCAPLTLEDDGPRADAAFDPLYAPDRVLGDGDRVAGRGWTIEAVATPGHTSNHLCFHLHEENALFTGDHIMGWSTTIVSPPDGDMGDYMRSMQRLADRDDVTVVLFGSANPDFFIAHLNVEILQSDSARTVDSVESFQRLVGRFRGLRQATIALVEGRVAGGGSEFLLNLDMRQSGGDGAGDRPGGIWSAAPSPGAGSGACA